MSLPFRFGLNAKGGEKEMASLEAPFSESSSRYGKCRKIRRTYFGAIQVI